jgi:Rrf2 family protein
MRLSSKGHYGIQAVFDLAYHGAGKAAQVREIGERQGIPARFLEQVFRDLRKAGLVRSKRGPRGGYELAHAPTEVRVGDIVRAIEGVTVLDSADQQGRGTSHPVLREVLENLARRVESCLDEVTIADLCARAEQLGVARGGATRYVYAI